MNIYNSHIDEIHSSEARYKNVLLRNNNIIIPYINLGISNHPLYEGKKDMAFINFAYIVFTDVSYLSVYVENKGRYIIIDGMKKPNINYFGGDYWDIDTKVFNDMEICSRETYLQTLGITKIAMEMWMPITTPNFNKNMNSQEIEDFFNHKYMPDNIQTIA